MLKIKYKIKDIQEWASGKKKVQQIYLCKFDSRDKKDILFIKTTEVQIGTISDLELKFPEMHIIEIDPKCRIEQYRFGKLEKIYDRKS